MSHSLTRLASAALLTLVAGAGQAQQIIAPTELIGGFSQSYLTAQFGQWSGSYPVGSNPTRDDTGAFSAAGNQGSYFFLGASADETPVVRNVTVRSDQKLFVSLLSFIDYVGGAVQTEAAMREELSYVFGTVSNLSLTVNGAPVAMPAGYSSLLQFRQNSPLFPITFIENNIYGVPASVLPAIAEGYVVALEALPVGNYQLHLTAHTDMSGPFAGFSMGQDITYNISSVPEPSTWAAMALGLAAIAALRRRRNEQR